MKNTDEDIEEAEKLEEQDCLYREEYLGYFESIKSVGRRSVNIYMEECRERKKIKGQTCVAFSNRDDEKRLFTRFHSRVVSDHTHQH